MPDNHPMDPSQDEYYGKLGELIESHPIPKDRGTVPVMAAGVPIGAPVKFFYDYPRPAVTVDCVVFRWLEAHHLQVLMIKRGKEPYLGLWALPGGHVNENEDLAVAAVRELEEETGLKVSPSQIHQVGAYGSPNRDPRGHYIDIAYAVKLEGLQSVAPIQGADDAIEARWFDLMYEGDNKLPLVLAFDHTKIILDAFQTF